LNFDIKEKCHGESFVHTPTPSKFIQINEYLTFYALFGNVFLALFENAGSHVSPGPTDAELYVGFDFFFAHRPLHNCDRSFQREKAEMYHVCGVKHDKCKIHWHGKKDGV